MSATILPFPDKPHKRRRSGMGAAGFLTLMLMEREGEELPSSVQRIDEPDGISLPAKSPELLLSLLIWDALPPEAKERVGRTLRFMAYGHKPDPAVVQLNNALNGRG